MFPGLFGLSGVLNLLSVSSLVGAAGYHNKAAFEPKYDVKEYDVKEFVELSGLSIPQINKLIRDGKLTAVRDKGKNFIRLSDIEKFINSNSKIGGRIIEAGLFKTLGDRIKEVKDDSQQFDAFYDRLLTEAYIFFSEKAKKHWSGLNALDSTEFDILNFETERFKELWKDTSLLISGFKSEREVINSALQKAVGRLTDDYLRFMRSRYAGSPEGINETELYASMDFFSKTPYSEYAGVIDDEFFRKYTSSIEQLKRHLDKISETAKSIKDSLENSSDKSARFIAVINTALADKSKYSSDEKKEILLNVGYEFKKAKSRDILSGFEPKDLLTQLEKYEEDHQSNLGELGLLVTAQMKLELEEELQASEMEKDAEPKRDKEGGGRRRRGRRR